MPLYSYSADEIRIFCKNTIESLEYWLRRLVDETLTSSYGANYINAKDASGRNIINNKIKKEIMDRMSQEPERYARPIDATVLESLVKILCNPKLFKEHFQEALKNSFPLGKEEVFNCLKEIISVRNCLYHANHISIRQAEKTICYSHDVIDSLKIYYQEKGQGDMYNVPRITKVSDSNSNCAYENQIRRNSTGRGLCDFRKTSKGFLYPGDKITIEVEIDPSFSTDEYTLKWIYADMTEEHKSLGNNKIELNIREKDVKENFAVYCLVISKKNWHRCGDCDDSVTIIYKILPPSD